MQEKTITIAVDEFKKNLALCINSSNLPAVIIENILQNFYYEAREISRANLEKDLLNLKNSKEKIAED